MSVYEKIIMKKFVVFEGIDGSGKSTQFEMFSKKIESGGNKIFRTREPTRDMIGDLISRRLKSDTILPSDINGLVYTLLFYADRVEHNHSIKNNLESGSYVLSDRYYYSTLAYQQTQGFDMDFIMDFHKKLVDAGYVMKPGITFFIDVPAEVAIERIEKREKEKAKVEIFERFEFLEKLRQNYLGLKESLGDNIVVIDGTGSVEEVFSRVWKEFENL